MKKVEKQTAKVPNEKRVQQILKKGAPPKTETPDALAPLKMINIKLERAEWERINQLREDMPKPRGKKIGISLHDWIIDAIVQRLDRDEAEAQNLGHDGN